MAFEIKRIEVNSSTWTAIASPFDSSSFGLKNSTGAELLIRTNADDATTEDTMDIDGQEIVNSPAGMSGYGYPSRFRGTQEVLYVKMATGTTGDVVVRWVR